MMPLRSIPAKLCRRLLWLAEDLESGVPSRYRRRYADCYATVRELRRLVPDGLNVAYDIGASRGHWAETLHAFFPGLRQIVLFEPASDCQEALRALRLRGTETRVEQVALGAAAGVAQLQGRGPSASLRKATERQEQCFPGSVPEGGETVVVEALDERALRLGLPPPDIVKLDVQGFEEEVMAGGDKTLAHARWLVLELSMVELYAGQRTAGAVLDSLEQRGWTLTGIGYRWYSRDRRLVQFDALLGRSINT